MGGPADRRGRDFGVQSGEAVQPIQTTKSTEKKHPEKRKPKEVPASVVSGQV